MTRARPWQCPNSNWPFSNPPQSSKLNTLDLTRLINLYSTLLCADYGAGHLSLGQPHVYTVGGLGPLATQRRSQKRLSDLGRILTLGTILSPRTCL